METILEQLNLEKKILIAIDTIDKDRGTIDRSVIGFLIISLVQEAAISAYEQCLLDQDVSK